MSVVCTEVFDIYGRSAEPAPGGWPIGGAGASAGQGEVWLADRHHPAGHRSGILVTPGVTPGALAHRLIRVPPHSRQFTPIQANNHRSPYFAPDSLSSPGIAVIPKNR